MGGALTMFGGGGSEPQPKAANINAAAMTIANRSRGILTVEIFIRFASDRPALPDGMTVSHSIILI